MDFLKFVNKGVEKSRKSQEAISEVNEVFKQVNTDLKKYPGGELHLERSISGYARVASITGTLAGVESEYLMHDRLVLSLKVKNSVFVEDIAGWKQRIDGYPCILKFDGQELSCSNPVHLISGMSELLASIGFGNAVNRLTKKALESADLNKRDASQDDRSATRASTSRSAAATPARALAKATSRVTTSPAEGTAAAKAGPAKPVAAKAPRKSRRRESDDNESTPG